MSHPGYLLRQNKKTAETIMSENTVRQPQTELFPPYKVLSSLVLAGAAGFAVFWFRNPERAWQAYLINFLFWSALCQGGLLFSMVMHLTKAKWSGPVQNLSEAFASFFPVSFLLFLFLFLGKGHLFHWTHEALHGKEVWLNIPFLFTRDMAGLLVLYGLGFGYLYYALASKLSLETDPAKGRAVAGSGRIQNRRQWIAKLLSKAAEDRDLCHRMMTRFAILYALAYTAVVSLISFDLVMSMDPHWISTLFGAYAFIKAFYIGLGGLMILSAIVYVRLDGRHMLSLDHFHDTGKLFFGFALVWAYFFYTQFLVIWYGNIPEETHFIIDRILRAPWRPLSIAILGMSFFTPFFVLLNERMKRKPKLMLTVGTIALAGIWLEHLLLLGPSLNRNADHIPLGPLDIVVTAGFFGLLAMAVSYFFQLFPELILGKAREA